MAGLQRKLLVCGKAGVGKSTLINSLFGRNVCKVNEPSLPSGHLGLGTTKVERAPPIRFGSSVLEIFDSPGLEIDEYLEDIHKNCKHVDLFLYCVEMNAARFTRDDKKSLELFTKRFGADFWKRCVLVLTKPNTVMVPAGKRHRYDAILEKFRAELELNGVSGTITSKIPVYAAGLSYYRSEVPLEALHDFRYIWYVSDGAKQPAEGRTIEFLTELWAMCLKSIEIIKAKEKYEQELKLTSAQQEEKMEELIAMHGQQEKRELEMKRKHNSAIVEPQFSGKTTVILATACLIALLQVYLHDNMYNQILVHHKSLMNQHWVLHIWTSLLKQSDMPRTAGGLWEKHLVSLYRI